MLKNKVLSYIISLSFILCALLSCIHFFCFFRPFYTWQHNTLKLDNKIIHEYIGISNEDLITLTDFTLDYLMDEDASLDIQMNVNGKSREIFTDDEKAHMVDVRTLNLIAYKIQIVSSIVFVLSFISYFIFKLDKNVLKKTYFNVLKTFAIIFVFLGLYILIDFDSFWTNFHHVFFSGNDLWLLDLRSDILIMIVPPDFFNHLVLFIFTSFICVLIIFSLFIRKMCSND